MCRRHRTSGGVVQPAMALSLTATPGGCGGGGVCSMVMEDTAEFV
jgi:hypothetical protein